jgi:anti-sigma-K factor RskA
MDLRSQPLRDALAAEYALGTLEGRAKRQFERQLQRDPALRREVARWQERLAPLDAAAAAVSPPARIWRGIQRRIAPAAPSARGSARLWDSAGFWRGAALAASLAALALAAYLAASLPVAQSRDTMVAVMADDRSTPAMTVSWQTDGRGDGKLRVRVIGHQVMDPGTAWELWLLPGGERKPVSLGLITTHETQTVQVPAHLLPAIDAAWGLAMSVEPEGGSPTGAPTGPVLYKGRCTRM